MVAPFWHGRKNASAMAIRECGALGGGLGESTQQSAHACRGTIRWSCQFPDGAAKPFLRCRRQRGSRAHRTAFRVGLCGSDESVSESDWWVKADGLCNVSLRCRWPAGEEIGFDWQRLSN